MVLVSVEGIGGVLQVAAMGGWCDHGGWCALWESQWTKLSCYGSKGARALWPSRVGVVL